MNVVRIITMLALVLLAVFQQLELRWARAAMAEMLAADQQLKTADDELKKSARRLVRACGIEGRL